MSGLSPEHWTKILIYSALLGLLILILAVSIYLLRIYLIEAAERDKNDIRKKVKLFEFQLRGFRDQK